MTVRNWKTIVLTVLVAAFLLCSCAGKKESPDSKVTEEESSVVSVIEETLTTSEEILKEEIESTSVPFAISEEAEPTEEEMIAHYCDLYSAETVYQDFLNPQERLLIGEKNVVELLLLGELSRTVEIDRKNIERIETLSAGEFTTLKIFDRTNHCITISADPQTAEEIVAVLHQDLSD